MAATGSNTIVADDVFVPAHRVLPLPRCSRRATRTRHNSGESVFQLSARGGADGQRGGHARRHRARRARGVSRAAAGAGITYTTYTNKSEAPVTHLQVGEAALKIDSADAHMRLACARCSTIMRARSCRRSARVKARAHVSSATGLAREAVDVLFYASGASAIQSHVPIQRFQRDMQALANHAIMHPQTTIELYGRVLCGLPPNTPLY